MVSHLYKWSGLEVRRLTLSVGMGIVGGWYRGNAWQRRDIIQCFANFFRTFASGKNNIIDNIRNGQRSSWTPEADTAGIQGSDSWRQYRVTFPARDIGLDQPYYTVQQTVVGVLQFRTCYYHVAEITRIYLVWTKIPQAVKGNSAIKGTTRKNIVPVAYSLLGFAIKFLPLFYGFWNLTFWTFVGNYFVHSVLTHWGRGF